MEAAGIEPASRQELYCNHCTFLTKNQIGKSLVKVAVNVLGKSPVITSTRRLPLQNLPKNRSEGSRPSTVFNSRRAAAQSSPSDEVTAVDSHGFDLRDLLAIYRISIYNKVDDQELP